MYVCPLSSFFCDGCGFSYKGGRGREGQRLSLAWEGPGYSVRVSVCMLLTDCAI